MKNTSDPSMLSLSIIHPHFTSSK